MKKIILIILIFCYISKINRMSSQLNLDSNAIYSIVNIVIENQNLNKNFGLKLEIENNCLTSDCNDSIVFEKLKNFDVYTTFNKCLTIKDIKFINNQIQNNYIKNWDNKKLNFNLNNIENYYVLSPPLFNIDKNIVLIKLEEFCNKPFCGQGRTLIFKKIDGTWESNILEQWFY